MFHNVEQLYLSNNNISSLEGLRQFVSVKRLSLSHNQVGGTQCQPGGLAEPLVSLAPMMATQQLQQTQDLAHLAHMSSLEHINLQGNPVALKPFYRSIAISTLPPSLKSLDGTVRGTVCRRCRFVLCPTVVPMGAGNIARGARRGT